MTGCRNIFLGREVMNRTNKDVPIEDNASEAAGSHDP